VRLRESLGLLTRPVEEELAAAETERAAWIAELRRVGLLSREGDVANNPAQIVLALYQYLGRTPSRLLGVSLTDAVGDRRTQNQPGTTDEYPNWRIPLSGPDGQPVMLEDVFSDPKAIALAEAMRAETAVTPTETSC
jgi:4-alpha-glucanotransferase